MHKAVLAFKQALLHGFAHRFARPAALLFSAESVPVSFSVAVEEHFASTRLPVEIPTVLRSIAHDQIRTTVMRQVAESRSTGYIRGCMKQHCVSISRHCSQLRTWTGTVLYTIVNRNTTIYNRNMNHNSFVHNREVEQEQYCSKLGTGTGTGTL